MNFTLNFHGIGEAVRQMEPGEAPYWISVDRFYDCLDLVEAAKRPVDITFDDGNVSDYEVALPILQKRSLAATFYVLVGKLDQPGYLTRAQLRAMASQDGVRIGSHGMDHVAWPELNDIDLERELATSKVELQEICGRKIDRAGIPFGRYDARVLRMLAEHGYNKVFSSDGGQKLTSRSPWPRFSVRSDTDLDDIARMTNGESALARLRNEARATVKSLLGGKTVK